MQDARTVFGSNPSTRGVALRLCWYHDMRRIWSGLFACWEIGYCFVIQLVDCGAPLRAI
jgi:hypothetical protein